MIFANPFEQPGSWFKGCLHVHSTISDGRLTPEEVVAWYRARGYHFLAHTDHGVWTPGEIRNDGFVILGGMEVEGVDPDAGDYHVVGLGLSQAPDLSGGARSSMQRSVNRLREAGGLVVIAHPYWCGQMSKDLLGLRGCLGLEVYNGGCEVDDAKGFSAVHWDDLLAAGQRLWGLAVDDAHWRTGDKDAGLGWVWVKASERSSEALLAALEQGHFYASTGPEIRGLRLEGDQLVVRTSPVVSIDFVGDGPRSHRVTAASGETLSEASAPVWPLQSYLRVACRDAAGGWAWANPLYRDGCEGS